jgi:antitoxin YefM
MMRTISYTQARSQFAKTMNKVCEDHAPIIIMRQGAKPVVMLALEDYESLDETAYLLHSRKNALHLKQSIAEIESGKAKERKLKQ